MRCGDTFDEKVVPSHTPSRKNGAVLIAYDADA